MTERAHRIAFWIYLCFCLVSLVGMSFYIDRHYESIGDFDLGGDVKESRV